ncbi:protocadherin gamma-B1 isoform X24 [Hippopotamus amphibius kiboko]|uniref:protocadherin gamma-B1 isoform X24 n=1 Tax=Hippopotamus amphibius kiboko TaxID=575201 RepID=UPI002599ED09|nr:protocadherin gamma-B1 isoform X24 [Hippopotamus amphibius kiboko]
MKCFLGLVEFASKSLLCHFWGLSLPHPPPPAPQKTLSALESLLRSSESGGREGGGVSLRKESGLAHCGQINVIVSRRLRYLRPLRPEQAPPNTDWRFSQAQRPGTSGSQNGDETGTWPNNQFDTEMLQAMILASASEAADGSSTLGGGAGTMGLSARYGPQFTLQHVPDYRQNVYIPGSNATLTNAAGKRDGKAPAGGNGNKKKSGKKEKK